jgi:predicted porin
MRRVLLGTTALVLALAPAGAGAADKLSLKLGGYFRAYLVGGVQDDDPGEAAAGLRDHGVARESEIYFQGKTTLDNGVVAGVVVELEGETSADQIDESYIYFDGPLGQLELGSQDGAAYQMLLGAPVPIPGHGVSDPGMFQGVNGTNSIRTSSTYVTIAIDRDKAIYFTPRIAGFQFGISYTPDFSEESGAAFRPDAQAGQQSEIIETGIQWAGRLGEVDLGVYAGYATANLETGGPGLEDQDQWGLGAEIAWRGLLVGASFRHNDLGIGLANSDRTDFNIGAAYSWDLWRAAIAWAHVEAEAGPAGGEDEMDQVEIGLTYKLGPGVALVGGVQFFDYDDDLGAPAAENRAVVGLLGTSLTF